MRSNHNMGNSSSEHINFNENSKTLIGLRPAGVLVPVGRKAVVIIQQSLRLEMYYVKTLFVALDIL